MDPSVVKSIESQLETIKFVPRKDDPTVFDIVNKHGALGASPTIITGFCELAPNGKKNEELRGIATYQAKGKAKFSTLKIALTDSTSGKVINACKSLLSTWREVHNPLKKSHWYQTTFGFEDGTKVYSGTGGIENPDQFGEYIFEGANAYEAPSFTFFNALYGDEEDAPWYQTLSIPSATPGSKNEEAINSAVLVLLGEDGKRIKAKLGTDCPLIPTTGVPLTDTDTIRKIEQSEWFKASRWLCKTFVQIRTIEWKKIQNAGGGDFVLVPVFKMRVSGNIVFKQTPHVLPEGVIPYDERAAIMNAMLFEGLEEPVQKKRKRSSVSKPLKIVVPKDKGELSESDIEGEEED